MWSAWRSMGWHRIWFTPLFILVLIGFVLPAIIIAFKNGSLIVRHFRWQLLISPSFGVWLAMLAPSVVGPIYVANMSFLPWSPGGKPYPRRVLSSFGILLVACCVAVISQFLLWGSLPLDNGNDGVIVRIIPFVPWPSTPFLP